MKIGEVLTRWPVLRQLREGDPLGLGKAARSKRSEALRPRIDEADHVFSSSQAQRRLHQEVTGWFEHAQPLSKENHRY